MHPRKGIFTEAYARESYPGTLRAIATVTRGKTLFATISVAPGPAARNAAASATLGAVRASKRP